MTICVQNRQNVLSHINPSIHMMKAILFFHTQNHQKRGIDREENSVGLFEAFRC
jgi:hypothetical protein